MLKCVISSLALTDNRATPLLPSLPPSLSPSLSPSSSFSLSVVPSPFLSPSQYEVLTDCTLHEGCCCNSYVNKEGGSLEDILDPTSSNHVT